MQALISAKELHALLDQQNVKLLDASISFQIPSESKKSPINGFQTLTVLITTMTFVCLIPLCRT